MDGALPSPSQPLLPPKLCCCANATDYRREQLNIESASSGLGGAGMGIGAIRKGDHYRESK